MKYIVAIFAMIVLAAADEWKVKTAEDLVKYRTECVTAKKVPATHIEKFKKFEFPEDETTRCYIECLFVKFGLFDSKKGGFKIDNLVKQLGQSRNAAEVRTEIEKCVDKNEQKSDSCTWAFRGFKCFISKNLNLVQQSIKTQ